MLSRKQERLRRGVCFMLALFLCLGLLPAAHAASGYDRPGQKLLALTFDDGPGAYSDSILDTLQKHGAKATFFLSGRKVSAYSAQVRRMVAEGHQIANHTYSHPMLTELSDAKVRQEVSSTAKLLAEVSGRPADSFYLRPPYGDVNRRVAAAAGVPVILWSVDTQDWKYQNAARLVSYTSSVAQDGDVVLMHETHKSTARGLDALLTALEAKGFELVTVEDLLWRRGIVPAPGQTFRHARDTGVNRCERSLWFDETRLETHWAYAAILSALEGGLMERNEYGEFLPNCPLTRAELVTALGRLYGADAAPPESAPFYDVPSEHRAAPYVAWAKETGVMLGLSANRFDPDRPITRAELAAVLARCALLSGAAPDELPPLAYADSASIPPWAAESVALCSALSLLEGSDGYFLPDTVATRAMGAVVLDRLARLPEPEDEPESAPEDETGSGSQARPLWIF